MQRLTEPLALARLAAIVRSSNDAIIGKDLNGIITDWNPAAERLLGYASDEAVGKHISLIAVPGRESDMLDILSKIRRGEHVEHYETQRRRKDGTIVDLSLSVSPIYGENGTIVGASKIARDVSERRIQEERLKLLMSELDHRAKNVLAIAQAILRLTRAETLPEFVVAVEGRIRALARVHSQVAENRWDGAELRSLASASLDTFRDGDAPASVDGPRVWLSPAAAQVVGVLLHELATNAVKHGALSIPGGKIQVRWSIDTAGELHLFWTERDGPTVSAPSRRSFGSQVIERNVPDQLGGSAAVSWAPSGLECEFVIPAANIVNMKQRGAAKP